MGALVFALRGANPVLVTVLGAAVYLIGLWLVRAFGR
jgi:hypothetical protein